MATSTRRSVEPEARRFSLTLVILALALLLVIPTLVDWRVRNLQRETDERSRARVLLNDLEASAIAQTLIAQRPQSAANQDALATETTRTATRSVTLDEGELDSLIANSRYARDVLIEIRAIEQSWRQALEVTRDSGRAERQRADPLVAFNTAEALDERLTRALDSTRARARSLQQLNVWSAAVLTPIALFSVLAVFRADRRSRRLARHLEQERAALAESIETRIALVRGITHDIKNPLGAAVGYTDLLLEGIGVPTLPPEQVTTLRRIRRLLVQSVDSITALLRLADRRGAADVELKAERRDLAALARDMVDDYRAAAAERSLSLEAPTSNESVSIVTDARHVQHILGNLLSNAVKYTPRGGKIVIRVAGRTGGAARGVRLEVRDSGPGIPRELRQRVFEEFFRADNAPDVAKGNGVGLSISRRLARRLGGDITVTAAPEGGAMFVLELPAAPESRST